MNAASSGKALAILAALAAALAAAPARAAEDGQASLITGLAETFGLVKKDDPQIDYRERSRLVVPRNMTLPPPSASPGSGEAWPTDVEAARERAAKLQDSAEPSAADRASRRWLLVQPGQDVKVTTSGFNRHDVSCRVPDPKTGECPEPPHQSMNWNPLTWVGLEKKPKVELGPEPERQNLVDPPKGYRAPAEGVGVKVDD